MPVCTNCGAQIVEGIAFCPDCGSPVAASQPASAPAPATAPMPTAAPAAAPVTAGEQAAAQMPNPAPDPAAYTQQIPAGVPVDNTVEVDLGKDWTAIFDSRDISENKVYALGAYLLGIVGVIVALLAAKDSPYAKFHARQAMLILVTQILLFCVLVLLAWTFIIPALAGIAMVVLGVLQIIAIINTLRGKAKVVPLIGALKFLN
ncbi:zinc-ribbon domain-containing protein [Adlercreutzia agrestimuris]|uniref:zinc-ribbon domain-containing protein n=1 Tax=Adlercreutzia agrestimuris TaxID=2941324 RepID=UPI00203D2B0C|nr:zinc-ribbon domain-containing protein [Adlercreutzia agrestimuris]